MQSSDESGQQAELRIDKPKRFRLREVAIIDLIGLLPGLILILYALSIPHIVDPAYVGRQGMKVLVAAGIALVLVSLTVMIVTFYYLPVWLGNVYVRGIVRKMQGLRQSDGEQYICQITFHPRVHRGIRGSLEDADDVGVITISESALSFSGDHIELTLEPRHVDQVQTRGSGYRALWLIGKRTRIKTGSLPGFEWVELFERESNTVPSSWRISRAMNRALHQLASRTVQREDASPAKD